MGADPALHVMPLAVTVGDKLVLQSVLRFSASAGVAFVDSSTHSKRDTRLGPFRSVSRSSAADCDAVDYWLRLRVSTLFDPCQVDDWETMISMGILGLMVSTVSASPAHAVVSMAGS